MRTKTRMDMKAPTVEYGLDWLTRIGNSISPGTPYVERVRITPDDAKAILARAEGLNFRKISKQHVERLSRMMKSGSWFDNGEPIQFDASGVLINGQHRLMAIIDSEVALDFDVRFNADDRGIDNIRARTAGQRLSHAGATNGRGVAAVLRLVHARSSGREDWVDNIKVEDFQLEELLNANRELAEMASAYSANKRAQLITGGIAGWLFYECASAGLEKEVTEFIEKLLAGDNLPRTSPIFWLRGKLVDMRQHGKTKPTRRTLIELVILAWNKYLKGESCLALRYEKSFPRLLLEKPIRTAGRTDAASRQTGPQAPRDQSARI